MKRGGCLDVIGSDAAGLLHVLAPHCQTLPVPPTQQRATIDRTQKRNAYPSKGKKNGRAMQLCNAAAESVTAHLEFFDVFHIERVNGCVGI